MNISLLRKFLVYLVNLSDKDFLNAPYRIKKAVIEMLFCHSALYDIPEWESEESELLENLLCKTKELFFAVCSKYSEKFSGYSVEEMCRDYRLMWDLGSIISFPFIQMESCRDFLAEPLEKQCDRIVVKATEEKEKGRNVVTNSDLAIFFTNYISGVAASQGILGKKTTFDQIDSQPFYSDIVNWLDINIELTDTLPIEEHLNLSFALSTFTDSFDNIRKFDRYESVYDHLTERFQDFLICFDGKHIEDYNLRDISNMLQIAFHYGYSYKSDTGRSLIKDFYEPLENYFFRADTISINDEAFIPQAYILRHYALTYEYRKHREFMEEGA